MGRFLGAVLALVVLLAAIILLAPNLIPAKTYKGRLEAAATTALGRTVTLGDRHLVQDHSADGLFRLRPRDRQCGRV